jgi:hypothetical protein
MSTPKMRAPCRAKSTAIYLPLPQPGLTEPQPVRNTTLSVSLNTRV